MSSSVKAGALVFVMAFALYSLTTFQLTGYDLETGSSSKAISPTTSPRRCR